MTDINRKQIDMIIDQGLKIDLIARRLHNEIIICLDQKDYKGAEILIRAWLMAIEKGIKIIKDPEVSEVLFEH